MTVLTERAGTDGTAAPAVTETTLRPRYEGCNINTWIGFKHVNYLVEEAVLDHVRTVGLPAGALYEVHGLCLELVAVDTRILTALHVDDEVRARVSATGAPLARGEEGRPETRLRVVLTVERAGAPVKAVTATVTVAVRLDDRAARGLSAAAAALEAPPAAADPSGLGLRPISRIRREAGRAGAPELAGVGASPPPGGRAGRGVVTPIGEFGLTRAPASANGVVWSWRIPYFYCHFTERLQLTGYLRIMEEIVDILLAERGVSIRRLLDDRNWIPVVPHSSVALLDEARMEEEVHTFFTVTDIFKDFTYTARMDSYVIRDGLLVPTATGSITHGYAVIQNRRDWSLVSFDDRLLGALRGG